VGEGAGAGRSQLSCAPSLALDAIASARFSAVQRRVGSLERVAHGFAGAVLGDADRHGHLPILAEQAESGTLGLRAHALDAFARTFQTGLSEYQQKFFAAVAAHEVDRAQLFLRDGRLLRLDVDGLPADATSMEVVYDVLSWRTGQFEFAAHEVPGEDLYDRSITALLLDHAKFSDESQR